MTRPSRWFGEISEESGDRQHLRLGLAAAAPQPRPDRVMMRPRGGAPIDVVDLHPGAGQATQP